MKLRILYLSTLQSILFFVLILPSSHTANPECSRTELYSSSLETSVCHRIKYVFFK